MFSPWLRDTCLRSHVASGTLSCFFLLMMCAGVKKPNTACSNTSQKQINRTGTF